jgi:hypothetical protein
MKQLDLELHKALFVICLCSLRAGVVVVVVSNRPKDQAGARSTHRSIVNVGPRLDGGDGRWFWYPVLYCRLG